MTNTLDMGILVFILSPWTALIRQPCFSEQKGAGGPGGQVRAGLSGNKGLTAQGMLHDRAIWSDRNFAGENRKKHFLKYTWQSKKLVLSYVIEY